MPRISSQNILPTWKKLLSYIHIHIHIHMNLPRRCAKRHGWSNKKVRKLLHFWSSCGSRHKHVGLKKGNVCRVFKAAWHLVTVTVEHDTETKYSVKVILYQLLVTTGDELIISRVSSYLTRFIYLIFHTKCTCTKYWQDPHTRVPCTDIAKHLYAIFRRHQRF